MKTKTPIWRPILWVALSLLLALVPFRGDAAGLLIADGGFGGQLDIEEHEVEVTINGGIAVTKVTQVFRNNEKRQVEALYTFPVPKGASVANFSMWINGKEMIGEVVEKKRAREIYESYKRKRQDPGLLEQADYRSFEMRVFPIAAEASQKVQVTYYQELDYDGGWATYVYPLATATRPGADERIAGRFAVSFDVKSAVPIVEMESPSHGDDFVIAEHGEGYWQASLESNGGSLARDVVLAHRIARPVTGLDLVTSRQPGEDGFFCLSVSVGEELATEGEGMDYVFVLDISGSMRDDGKLLLSKDCVGAFLDSLGPADRFEVIAFNVKPEFAFRELRAATETDRANGRTFLSTLSARGGTVLNPAVTGAYRYADADRPLNVVILSDGMTEQRERRELLELIQARPRNARVFCVGVGNDVNRPLLEQLAEDSGGLAAFVSHGDNFERQAKAFRRKLTRPVATDLKLNFGGIEVSQVEPKELPNLYHGTPVRLYGRYRGDGEANVTFRASVNGVELTQSAVLTFPETDGANPEIERVWASRRIDGLLKAADRLGNREEVVDEVVRLGETFSVVTEYTSFLVLENDAEFRRWSIERKNALRMQRDRTVQDDRGRQLEALRRKASTDLGPQPSNGPKPTVASAPIRTPQTSPGATSQSRDLNIFHGGGGSGPVGPLFVGALALFVWIRNRFVARDAGSEE